MITGAELIDELARAGVTVPNANAGIESAAANRGLQAKAIAVIFGAKSP